MPEEEEEVVENIGEEEEVVGKNDLDEEEEGECIYITYTHIQ